jgi:penicillin-binding protein 1B
VPVKIKARRRSLLIRFLINPWGKAFLLAFIMTIGVGVSAFVYVYDKYARLTDEKLRAGPFSNTSLLYAAPRPVEAGQESSVTELADYLRRCGYSESSSNRLGWFHLRTDAIEINPGPDSYDSEGAVIKIRGGKIAQIISQRDQTERTQYLLEPELITNLFDKRREKRRIVHFNDIPKVMVDALLAAEDKHFFTHAGFDPVGIVRAAWKDVTEHRMEGASTLSMQLAGCLWLSEVDRGWRRKFSQTMITLHLERKLTKQEIFEDYANAVPLGQVGSFSIQGFGQASEVYLGKDLSKVSIAEAAFLAGLVQAPSRRNPFRHPAAATARRNVVLKAMLEDGFINQTEFDDAVETPLKVTREEAESSDAPYFVDLVNDTLQSRFEDEDFHNGSYRVYTTLDPDLQRDAVDAVRIGIQETDQQWHRKDKTYGTDAFPLAQVALICIDAETGEVKALVGGRNYGLSQLDHAVAHRQPGSSFKPFVYATAFATALRQDGGPVITPATVVANQPTTFWYDDKPYEPANFKNEYSDDVPAWYALTHSLNIPAVKFAEMAGYDNVAKTARAAGLNVDIKPTPSIALGAYEVTPLEIAGAYTVFANRGELISTSFIKTIRDQAGKSIYTEQSKHTQALDPRVAYLVENTMEEVLRSGTGAAVRAKGFTLPAAGKTGTSRDGWFAGFTSKLICVVWVGFDDNRDFKLEGAHSALPIWFEFMKRAHQHREYRDVHPFDAPDGIVTAQIDAETGELATPACPKVRNQVFISGTQPVDPCHLHGSGKTEVASWDTPAPAASAPAASSTPLPPYNAPGDHSAAAPAPAPPKTARSIPITPSTPDTDSADPQPKKKRGFFGRIKDLFKDDKSKDTGKEKN